MLSVNLARTLLVLLASDLVLAQVLPSPGLEKSVPQVEVTFAGLGRGASEASVAYVKDELKRSILSEITALKHGIVADLLQGAKPAGAKTEGPRRERTSASGDARLGVKQAMRPGIFLATHKDVVGDASGYEKAEVAMLDVELQAQQLQNIRAEIQALTEKVRAGGQIAKGGLSRLMEIFSQPNVKTVAEMFGVVAESKKLMEKAETTDEVRGLAGSLITLMTDLPVVSEVSSNQGSYGHVNVVLPRPSRIYQADAEILELQQGAKPSATRDGSLLG